MKGLRVPVTKLDASWRHETSVKKSAILSKSKPGAKDSKCWQVKIATFSWKQQTKAS